MEFDNSGKTLLDPKLFNEIGKTTQRPFTKVNAITTENILNPHQVFHIRATRQGGITMIDKDLKKCIIKENKKDKWLLETLTKVKTLGPRSMKKGLQEWNDKEGLILYRKNLCSSE